MASAPSTIPAMPAITPAPIPPPNSGTSNVAGLSVGPQAAAILLTSIEVCPLNSNKDDPGDNVIDGGKQEGIYTF
jgi:hypothetical protein